VRRDGAVRGDSTGIEYAGGWRALVASAVRSFGRLDVLVANHGIWESADAPIAAMKEAQWRRTLG